MERDGIRPPLGSWREERNAPQKPAPSAAGLEWCSRVSSSFGKTRSGSSLCSDIMPTEDIRKTGSISSVAMAESLTTPGAPCLVVRGIYVWANRQWSCL